MKKFNIIITILLILFPLIHTSLYIDAKTNDDVDIKASYPGPGSHPHGLCWRNQNLCCVDLDYKKIYTLNPENCNIIEEINITFFIPLGLTWDGHHYWCVCDHLSKIFKIDPSNGSIVHSINCTFGGWGLTWDGQYLWNADGSQSKIHKIDSLDGRIIKSIDSPGNSPTGLTWDGEYLWNADSVNKKIYALDPKTGEILFEFDSPGNTSSGLTWDGQYLWNADCVNTIYKIDIEVCPNTPKKSTGPENGIVLTSYNYSSSTIDINNDELYYNFSWGDGTNSEWLGPYLSGQECEIGHDWKKRGEYNIRVKAKDIHNQESKWSDPLTVSISPLLDRVVMCEKIEEDGNHGPPKKEFSYRSYVYCWTLVYGCKKNDIIKWKWEYIPDEDIRKTLTRPYKEDDNNKVWCFWIPDKLGEWQIKIFVNDKQMGVGPIFSIVDDNIGPEIPEKPSGPKEGKVGETYTFSTFTYDVEGDKIWFLWWFGDIHSGWMGPYDPYEKCKVNHIWNEKGSFVVRVKAMDAHGNESLWSSPLIIDITEKKTIKHLFKAFLEKYADLYPLIKFLLRKFLTL